jgi:hypothetical protein
VSKNIVVTASRAREHEALYTRLCALLDQLKPLVAKHPEAPASPVVASQVGELLDTTAWIVGEKRAEREPGPDMAGLAAQLVEAKAQLEHFEAQHSAWDKNQNAHVWLLRNGMSPIRRLRPLLSTAPRRKVDPAARQLRLELERRINAITKGMV